MNPTVNSKRSWNLTRVLLQVRICCIFIAVIVVGGGGGGGVVVVVGRHKDKAPVQTTRSSLEDEMTKPPWNMVVHCIWVS